MEKNTLLIDIEVYNQLRDFKREMELGNTLMVYPHSIQSNYEQYHPIISRYITRDEAVKEVVDENNKLNDEIEKLKSQIEKLKSQNKPKEISLSDVKKMSLWEFRKWRKS